MDSNNRIAIFTIVNKEEVFRGFVDSLETQKNVSFELFPIMNCHGEYSSARHAYNEAATGKDFKYYVFSHPDIRFLDENALSDIIGYIDSLGSFGVAGVAGAVRENRGRKILTTILQGADKQSFGEQVNKPEQVQTLDECMFFVDKDYFNQHPFSDTEGWHLYSVEYCLDAEGNQMKNYVVPSRIWHLSAGSSLDEKYMSQLEKLISDYQDRYEVICTTVKAWPTKGAGCRIYRKYYWLKQRIKRAVVRR